MSLLLKLKSSFLSKSKILKICFIGLDQAGKSSILKRLLDGDFNEFNNKRTVGMEVSKFESEGIQCIAWDIGGQRAFRETVWQSYLMGSKAVIYVIDSTDLKRLQESKQELDKYIFSNPKFNSIPVLILANKQDLPSSLSCEEIEFILNLDELRFPHVKLFGISCKTGLNIVESFTWLNSHLNSSEKKNMFNPTSQVHPLRI